MARAITDEANLPPYAQPYPSRIQRYGFDWRFFADRKLADQAKRVQVRDTEHLAPPREVARYAAALERGDQMPPVIMTADGYLIDGHTRTEAARRLGWTTLPTFVLNQNYSDAPATIRKQLQALGAGFNTTHGRGMTKANIAAIIADITDDDESPKDVARRMNIPEGTANTYVNAAKAARRAARVDAELDGTLTASHLRMFGNKSKYFSDPVFREFILLAQEAKLSTGATTALAKRLEATGTENERLTLLQVERAGYRNIIKGGPIGPSKAAKLRQSLGFLNGQDDLAALAEFDPNASEMHTRAMRDAIKNLQAVLSAQELVEGSRVNHA